MFVVLYRWRIKLHLESQFIAAWSEITAYYRENFDSLGSRLHRGNDGLFYSYAQWKSLEQRERAFQSKPDFTAIEKMREAVEESFPEIILETISDYIIPPEKSKDSFRLRLPNPKKLYIDLTETVGGTSVSSGCWGEDSNHELAGAAHFHVASPALSF